MNPVFGRLTTTPHDYEVAINSWLARANLEERAFIHNLMYDHRVSVEREKEFDTFVKRPCTAENLKRACDDYFKEKVRRRRLPHYVYRAINGVNVLNGHIGARPSINKYQKLVRVLDINGLKLVFQWARTKRRWGTIFKKFPGPHNEKLLMKWLDERMANSTERFVEVVLDVVSSYRSEGAFQPVWVTTWSAFSTYVADGPERWLQVLGLFKQLPSWVLLLCYTVAEAGTIARPTQLDAGRYAYHFPSPPQAPLRLGGHPMDIQTLPPATVLLPEYIHKQISHPFSHWTDPGSYCGRTGGPSLEDITDQRTLHHRLLANSYGASIYGWMNSPM